MERKRDGVREETWIQPNTVTAPCLGLALARRAAERGARPWIGVRALRSWLHRGRRPVEPPGNLAGGVVKYLTMAHIHPRPGTGVIDQRRAHHHHNTPAPPSRAARGFQDVELVPQGNALLEAARGGRRVHFRLPRSM